MSNQPKWKRIANLGDVNPVEYGGYFIYQDRTGKYEAEGELLMAPDSDDSGEGWTMYRFPLDRCQIIEDEDHISYLVTACYATSWPYPVSQYDEWFHKDLPQVAAFADLPNIREMLCSANPLDRAEAYKAIGDYHGLENLDGYPRHYMKRSELPRRWRRHQTGSHIHGQTGRE